MEFQRNFEDRKQEISNRTNILKARLDKKQKEVEKKLTENKDKKFTKNQKEDYLYKVLNNFANKWKVDREKQIKEKEDEEEKDIKEKTIEETLKIFHKWIYFNNDYDVTIPSAYAISNFSDTDPGMLGIIAPSGAYKTEIIRAFAEEESKYVYPIDNLTARTFVSGLKNVEDIIPKLRRRLITVKDFTSLLSKKEDERVQIFSDFREIMDGYLTRKFGSGKEVNYRKIHSSVLFGSTKSIEKYYSLNSTLGQRIIFYKPNNNPEKATQQAYKNMNKTDEMRKELNIAMRGLLKHILTHKKDELMHLGDKISKEVIETLQQYVFITAILRTHVHRDYRGNIEEMPEIEYPTRLFKEIVKIIASHSILYEREVNNNDIKAGLAVLTSNIPSERLAVISVLLDEAVGDIYYEGEPSTISTKRIANILQFSAGITKKNLDELLTLGIISIIGKGGREGDSYYIPTKNAVVLANLLRNNIVIKKDEKLLFVSGDGSDRGMYVNLYINLLSTYLSYINHPLQVIKKDEKLLSQTQKLMSGVEVKYDIDDIVEVEEDIEKENNN